MLHHARRTCALIVAAAALAACGDGTAPEPTNLADVLSDVAEIEAYASAGGVVGGLPMLPSETTGPGACVFAAPAQRFECPPVTHGGLTMTRSFQLLDGSNAPQAAFDPATTAGVRTVLDVSGTVGNGTAITGDVLHHSDQTVGGLLGATRTVDGESSTRFIRVSSLGTDTLNTATTTDLSIPRATGRQRVYPTGSVATVMSSSSLPAVEITSTMTFNGTSTAILTMDFGGFTRSCTVNLDQAGPPTCPTIVPGAP